MLLVLMAISLGVGTSLLVRHARRSRITKATARGLLHRKILAHLSAAEIEVPCEVCGHPSSHEHHAQIHIVHERLRELAKESVCTDEDVHVLASLRQDMIRRSMGLPAIGVPNICSRKWADARSTDTHAST